MSEEENTFRDILKFLYAVLVALPLLGAMDLVRIMGNLMKKER